MVSLAASLSFGAARANADTINFTGLGHYSVVRVTGPITGDVFAGEYNWQWIGTPPVGFTNPFYTYCLDIMSAVVDPQTVAVKSTSDFSITPDAGAKAAWLLNSYAPAIRSSTAANANILAAALQVAIWEAIYDTTNNLTAGIFTLGTQGDSAAAVMNQANAYLASLYYAPGAYYTSTAVWLDTNEGQDQITIVPEPGTLSMLAFGCLALSGRRRRTTPVRVG